MVTDRETSHYHIFKRRIAELGYAWAETPDANFEERLQVSGSTLPDVEKIRWGKERQASGGGQRCANGMKPRWPMRRVDPLTRSLLRWFAEVEADWAPVCVPSMIALRHRLRRSWRAWRCWG